MPDDNILPFPNKFQDTFDEAQWQSLQGEFYLDCFMAQNGFPAGDPEQLRTWLEEHQLYADLESPFFRGWLLRRLSEAEN